MGARVLTSLALCLLPAASWADGPLRSLVVFGNEKTERSTILSIAGVAPQTYVNNKLLQEVDDRLVNSGLFRSVSVRKADNADGTTDLRIIVVEKQLWFAFPVFQAWSGRYSGGAVFGESNLFHPNMSTLLMVQGGNKLTRGSGLVDTKRLFETNAALRCWLSGGFDDVPLYAGETKTDEIRLKDVAVSLIPGWQWTNEIRTSFKFLYRRVHYGLSAGVAEAGGSGNEVSFGFEFLYDSLRRREAFLKGWRLRVGFDTSEKQLGTDYPYHMESLEMYWARRFTQWLNYVVSFQGTMGQDLPFHKQLTLGASTLRGYRDRQFRGDTMVELRQEALVPIYRHRKFSLFSDLFLDSGLLYFEERGAGRGNWRNGVGAGLRVSLSEILAPVFGLDVGYGIEENAVHVYVALGLVLF